MTDKRCVVCAELAWCAWPSPSPRLELRPAPTGSGVHGNRTPAAERGAVGSDCAEPENSLLIRAQIGQGGSWGGGGRAGTLRRRLGHRPPKRSLT